MSVKYVRKNPLCKNIVFVDGITRSGKKLTCKVVSHLKGIDYFQYQSIAEHIAYAHFLGKIDSAFGSALLQYQIEEHLYNRIIGRNLNTRLEDETNVSRSPDYGRYVERGKLPGGTAALELFEKEGRRGLFHVHSVMPAIDVLFQAFPELALIHVNRHPVDLAIAWVQHGWGEREISDPLAFGPLIKVNGHTVPWFAAHWVEKYLSLNIIERAVESVLYLQNADEAGYDKLDILQKQKIVRFPLELLTMQTDEIIRQFSQFLDTQPHAEMEQLLRCDERPKSTSLEMRQGFFNELREKISNESLRRLTMASREYEYIWGLPACQ